MSKTIRNHDEVYEAYGYSSDKIVKGRVCDPRGALLHALPKSKSITFKRIYESSEVLVNLTESKKGWYCIEVLPGLQAYCLKETIELVMEE